MYIPPHENFRVVRYAEGFGYSAREWAEAFSEIDWRGNEPEKPEAEPLKDGRRSSVWRSTLRLGRGTKSREIEAVLKIEPLGTPWRRLKALFCSTKAHRQWRGAAMLREAGVSPAEPLAVLRSAEAEALVLAHHAGATALEAMHQGLGAKAETLTLQAIATTFARLWSKRVYLDDPKPSNLLIDPSAANGVRILDTVGVFEEARDALAEAMSAEAMLVALYLEPTGCGLKPRRSLCMRLLREVSRANGHELSRSEYRRLWRALAADIEAHGDPTPVDDPLAKPPPLRS